MLRRIYDVENTVVPAGHAINVPVTLALSSLRQTSGDWAVEPRSLGIGILAARTLMRGEGRRSAVQVMNVGESDFVLRQGEFVGEAEQVVTIDGEETATKQPEDEETLSKEAAVSAIRLAEEFDPQKRSGDVLTNQRSPLEAASGTATVTIQIQRKRLRPERLRRCRQKNLRSLRRETLTEAMVYTCPCCSKGFTSRSGGSRHCIAKHNCRSRDGGVPEEIPPKQSNVVRATVRAQSR